MSHDTQMSADARWMFHRRVEISEGGCWIFPTTSGRYGQVTLRGRHYSAHRLAYESFVGSIGDLHVCHTCDTPQCVNPEHLFLGTHRDNIADMVAKDRSGARELRNSRGKLTDSQVREIRARYANGATPRDLANAYGVSANWIRSIVTHRVVKGYRTRHYA